MIRKALSALAALTVIATSAPAGAAGMFWSDRGVVPMGRGGAMVAGANDLGAFWYNPAGLSHAAGTILTDSGYTQLTTTYARELRIVDADATVRHVKAPPVDGHAPFLPIPTVGLALAPFGSKTITIAGVVYGPYLALPTFDETTKDGKPSPARYSLGSSAGTLMALGGVFAAWNPESWIRLGMGVEALAGIFQTTMTFNASPPDRIIGAPEQPEFDAKARLRVGPIFAPTVSGGVILEPFPYLRVGVSGKGPFVVNSPAEITVRLPNSVAFDSANVEGKKANVRFLFPPVLRAGVEVQPIKPLKIEVAIVREFWSVHEAIDATPQDIKIVGVTGAPREVSFPKISVARNFRDANSYRIGAEYTHTIAGHAVTFRAGGSYDESAVANEYVS
ncbi:MAG: hypothetical protein U0169_13150, partial [Polyangiaceae bacterium]